jgi:hypothetical protein
MLIVLIHRYMTVLLMNSALTTCGEGTYVAKDADEWQEAKGAGYYFANT